MWLNFQKRQINYDWGKMRGFSEGSFGFSSVGGPASVLDVVHTSNSGDWSPTLLSTVIAE